MLWDSTVVPNPTAGRSKAHLILAFVTVSCGGVLVFVTHYLNVSRKGLSVSQRSLLLPKATDPMRRHRFHAWSTHPPSFMVFGKTFNWLFSYSVWVWLSINAVFSNNRIPVIQKQECSLFLSLVYFTVSNGNIQGCTGQGCTVCTGKA